MEKPYGGFVYAFGSIINVGVRENNLQNRNKKSRAYF
jgi:hypothetical protein